MVSKIEIASRPMTSTSSVLRPRWTNTLSMTTWKNRGDTRANNCRKNDATSTSLRRCRYLWIAPINQVMSKRRVISDNPARRAIRISPPSQTARSSARVIKAGRDASGDCTRTLSSPPWRPREIRHRTELRWRARACWQVATNRSGGPSP